MYRIHQMEVVDGQGESGVCISWIPNGLVVERVHKKLDVLRSQYESQLSLLQGQLEAERKQNHHSMDANQYSYEQFLSSFCEKLDGDQKDLLDELITKLTAVHDGQIKELRDKHKHDVSAEVMAIKLTLEQVYMSKGQLEVSAVEARHEEEMKEMKEMMEKELKERLNTMMAQQHEGNLDTSLTDKYNKLIQKISQALDDNILADTQESSPDNKTEDGDTGSSGDHHRPLSQEIRNLLITQQEEISSLRSQMLGEYESVLQSRTQSMMEQTQGVSDLEEQLKSLQTQYSEQVENFQAMLSQRDEEQKKMSEDERNTFEQQQAELKSHYGKKVQDMEASFEKEINFIKEKYEDQISGMIHARLGGLDMGDTNQSAGVDTDSDNADTPRSSATDTALRIKELEKELEERDAQVKELKACLDYNDNDVNTFKNRIEELEGQLSDAKSVCSQLEVLVEEKKHAIETLEQEKKESEKLYRDLLERESPRSKGSAVRDYVSSDSVDDSFSSAVQDTPRSLSSPDLAPAEADTLAEKDTTEDNGQEEKDDEHNDTIPFANESSEYADSAENNNNNNKNNSNSGLNSTSSLEEQVSSLKKQLEDLSQQLEEVKASEKMLQSQIDESQHKHLEMLEDLRQELEHEKQVEVETLQSEFKVQMDIELKRQAAELISPQPTTQEAPCSSEQQTLTEHSDMNISGKLFSTLETADDNILEASSSSNMFLKTANFELQTVVMTSASLPGGEDGVEENLSDDSKVTSALSPVSSPTHTVATAAPVTQSLPLTDMVPLTDMEKEMQAMRDEYEGKMAHLSSEIERMNEERKSLVSAHQQRVEELEDRLNETEARYDRLMEGVQSGDHPELNDLMKDKYDQELDLAKSLMQKDFDEMLATEKKKLMEHHRKLMGDFMEDKGKDDEESQEKHEQELKDLKERLESDFETRVQGYEQEIERLNRDLDLLRETTPRGSDEGTRDSTLSTLPEIEEITLQNQDVESESPNSEKSMESSTSLKSPGLSYEESEEEETEAEKNPTLQIRSFDDTIKAPSPSPSLLKEKEDLELTVQQLVAQVQRLTQQLAERQSASPVSPLHSPHNTTLKAEDPALITMLQSDLDRISAERESVQNTNDRLLSLLSDTVKTYIGVEDAINRKLTQVVSGTPRSQSQGDSGDASRAGSVELGMKHGSDSQGSRQGSPSVDYFKGASPDVDTSQDSHALDNTSILSNATDEGLEISQRLAESIFVGPDLDEEGEEILSDARGRLTSAVGQLLELMEQSTIQLHEAKNTQEELLATLASRTREVDTSQSRSSELNSQLASEIEAKEYLGLELHKAEGLIAGYAADRETNEKQIHALEEQREALIVELDSTRSRLEDFQRSQSEIDSVREELAHQQTLLRENVGQETQEGNGELPLESTESAPALLNEVSNLNQERRELATQLQHQLDLSRKRLSEMEALAEEAERKHENVVEEKNRTLDDMHLQLENTERQLKSSKAFVDELLVEREQEREEHQKEIEKMKETIEGKDRSANSQERMQREIADLTEQLQARITTQTGMHQRIVELQKVLEDKELSTNDLKVWVSQLEGELDQKFSAEDQLKERISKLERQLTEKSENNEEVSEEEVKLVLSPRSEDTEETTSNQSSTMNAPRPSLISLEEELQKSKETKEELDQENNTLKQQLHDQMLQISGLKNQVDQMRHYAAADDSDAAQLRERLAQERDQMEKKEAELAEAERKIEHLESILQTKQMEANDMSSKVSRILEMGEAQEENERLRNEMQELKSQMSESQSSSHHMSMPASLLEEKNEEISELKTRLQVMAAEIEEKADRTTDHQEKILQLQQRLKDRNEEIVDLQDSLACARQGETCLDMSLPLTDEAGSMLNISMTGRTSIQQEFEDTIAKREGEMHSLEEQFALLKRDLDEKDNELKEFETKLLEKKKDLDNIKSELSEKDEEIQKLQQELLVVAKANDEMKSSLEDLQNEKQNQSDQEKVIESLENSVEEKDNEIYQLTLEIQELKNQLDEAAQATEAMEKVIEAKESELTQVQEDRDEKRDQLQEKEHKLDQMVIQIDGFQAEISGLTTFQTDLQKDFDTIQSMLDEKEKELESLTQELTDTKSQQDVLNSMMQLERMVASLQKELVEKENVVEEKEEELYELRDKLEDMENVNEDLDSTKLKLKKAGDDLETEKKSGSQLQESLSKEEANAETLKQEMNQISEELKSLKEKLHLAEETIEEKGCIIKSQEENVKLVEKTLEDNRENAGHEMKILVAECDKIKKEYDVKVKDLEEQLQVQDANYLAMSLAASKELNQSQESQSSKFQPDEKDALVEDFKRQIDSLKQQLQEQSKELEELPNVQRQLEEMDEQLRYRQSVLLEAQAENERLSDQFSQMNNIDVLKKQLEEKEHQVNELEGQLRFRQSALLELESDKDNVVEEKAELELRLRKELEEKEKEFQELQVKYVNLKDGINEEVLHMEQEMKKSSQARVMESSPTDERRENTMEDLTEKLLQRSAELADLKNEIEDIKTEVSRKNHELEVRKNTINDLLEDLEALRSEKVLFESKDKELEKLQGMIKEAEEKASLEASTIEKLRKAIVESEGKLRQAEEGEGGEEIWMDEVVFSQTNASLSAAPPSHSEESSSQNTIHDDFRNEIQEKEKNIKSLTSEIDQLKCQIEEQDRVILSLKDELEISVASHQEQVLSRDRQISELQETIKGLKPQSSLEKVQMSEDNSLSPQTKQQISQLKSQLRKAHAALEEMQENGEQRTREAEVDEVDSGRFINQGELKALRKIVQEQEEELVVLKAQMNAAPVQEDTIQAEKADLAESSRQSQHERDLDAIRQDMQNLTETRSSRGYSLEECSIDSSMGNSDGVPHRIQALLDKLHGLGEDLLSASDFDYLQRHLFQRPDDSSSDTSAWSRERAALMNTIVAVKDLLQQADRLAAKSVEELSGPGDWRGDLLDALVQVYQSERHVLKAEVEMADDTFPEMDIITQLESRIHELEQVHQRGLDEMLKADRQSLLDEVDDLHHRLLEAKTHLQDTRHSLDQRIEALEEAKSKAEWKLQRQIQMLEYKIQQEGVIQEDLKKSLSLERQRVSELSSQSSFERSKTLELQSELSSTQIQLSKVRDALEREQHRFNSVTDALEEEQAKTIHLAELLDATKKKLTNLKEDVAYSDAQHQQVANSESVFLKELKTELDKERQTSYEHSQAEERAQNQIVQLSEKLDNLKKKLLSTREEYESKIENLHREWMEREIDERKQRETETVTKLTDLLDVERESHRKALEIEKHVVNQLKDALEQIKSENDKLLQMYELENSRADKLKREMDSNRNSNDMLRHLRGSEKEAKELQQKVLELEEELCHVHDRASALEAELSRSRENGTHNGRVSASIPGEYHRDAISSLMTATYVDEELKVRLAQCCTRLQMIASKLQDMKGDASQGSFDGRNGEEEDGSTGLHVVMEELEKLKANIRDREEKRQNSLEKDRTLHSEQLLQHNKQLAEHVKKLKMEKEDLTGALKKMEQQMGPASSDKRSKMSLPQYTSDATSDEEGVYDRTVWASEKLSLQMALDSAEHEIQHLRTELRRFSSLTKADGQLIKLDPDKTQRLYGKYLRAESFRKALIYQKKYLLLLLGGYRDTEKETLAILASMGSFPSPRTQMINDTARARPLSTFRSAGRAVISIFRMKYLVRKWKRATRVGSPVMTGQITTQHGYVPTSSSSYTLPQYRQQQQQSQPQQKPQYHHHHRNNHLSNSSSLAPSTTNAVASSTINSRVSSDYVESLTNGGVSSFTNSNSGSNNIPLMTATSHQPHQVPSHLHRPHNNYNTTPPTKDSSKHSYNHKAARGNRDTARRQILQGADSDSPSSQRGSARPNAQSTDSDDETFMRYLENVQQQLSEGSTQSRRVTWR